MQKKLQNIIDITVPCCQEAIHTRTAPFGLAAPNKETKHMVHPRRNESTGIWIVADPLVRRLFTFHRAHHSDPCRSKTGLILAHVQSLSLPDTRDQSFHILAITFELPAKMLSQ